MDAFVVALTKGMTLKRGKVSSGFKIAFSFGLFQGIMPLLGWLVGSKFKNYITHVDHWIAFILLAIIGSKMLYESFNVKESEVGSEEKDLSFKLILLLSVATSIDALAVGVSFAFLEVSILSACIMIAFITFIISFMGVFLGKVCGNILQSKAEILGGVILIFIGIKILWEHLEISQVIMNFIK